MLRISSFFPAICAAALLTGCTPTVETPFPDGFLWGTATAGFQVEAGCPTIPSEECEDRNSDWYQWVTDPELADAAHRSDEPLDVSPGMWELIEQDMDRATGELSNNAIRISLEWSRIFPDPAAESATTVSELGAFADAEAVARYREIIGYAREIGLDPLVTLNHYTLPLWIHDGKSCNEDLEACADKGWLDGERLIPAIALYSGYCGAVFGDLVDRWATLNEPLAVVLSGYIQPGDDRSNPPGVDLQTDAAFDVAFNMIFGHARMYDAVHEHDTQDADGDGTAAFVGVVHNLVVAEPADPDNPEDVRGAEQLDYVYNRLFLNGTVLGELDRDVDGEVEETDDTLAGRMDYIGINYYTKLTVEGLSFPLFPGYPMTYFWPGDDIWQRHPAGIADVIEQAAGYGKPIIITEAGTPDVATDVRYFNQQVRALGDALDAGHPVLGYFVWTLVDNYEWNHGMNMRFGMYELDTATKSRTLRPAGARFAEIASSNGAVLYTDE